MSGYSIKEVRSLENTLHKETTDELIAAYKSQSVMVFFYPAML